MAPKDANNRKRRGRGEGGVRYDEARSLWVASVSLGYHADGRRNRPVAYGRTKAEALAGLDRLRREAGERPGGGEAARMTVGELLDLWMGAKTGKIAGGTLEYRQRAVERVRAAMGQEVAAKLTPLRVARFHQSLAAVEAPSAVWHAAQALSGCLSHAVALQILPSNPAKAAGMPALPQREMTVLSAAQARALLEHSRDVPGCYPFLAVALGTGIRQGELLGLQWDDLALGGGGLCSLSVRRALVRTQAGGPKLQRTKTKASRRTITLPEFAAVALREVHERNTVHSADGIPPGRTVFCRRDGGHFFNSHLFKLLRAAIARANVHGAGIPEGGFRFHDMRHTHASLLLSAGHSIRAVSARLGHTNPAFTLSRYSWLMPGDDERLAVGMQTILG